MKDLRLQSSPPSSVVRVIRRLKGGSQSLLVECADGQNCVLKLNGNPQGSNVLANELFGNVMGRAVGLPVGLIQPVSITEAFLDENPLAYFDIEKGGRRRPAAGTHLACSLIGALAPSHRRLELIGRSEVKRITNTSDFLGMYLFDVWAMHQDHRQAIFLSHRTTRKLSAFFIDNGHLCGGPKWDSPKLVAKPLHSQHSIYHGQWDAKEVSLWTKRFQEILPEKLLRFPSLVPAEWHDGNLDKLCSVLTARLAILNALFREYSLEGLFDCEDVRDMQPFGNRRLAHG